MYRNLLVPTSILVMSTYLWSVAANFRPAVGRYESIGPSFFPHMILAGLILLSTFELVRGLIIAWKQHSAVEGSQHSTVSWLDLFLTLAIMASYAASLRYLGFLVTTVLFQFAMLLIVFRRRQWQLLIGAPLGLTALYLVIFVKLMHIPLPRGSGIFRQFSQLFY